MQIEGTYTIQATLEDVWLSLKDTRLLQETIPGLEHLELLEEPAYTFVIQANSAPLLGTYRGHVTIVKQIFPTSYNLTFTTKGEPGTINGTLYLNLREHNNNAVVAYTCSLHADMPGTLSPAALVKGNIKHLFQQFFTNFAGRLRASVPSAIGREAESQESLHIETQPIVNVEASDPSVAEMQPVFLLTMVRLFRLGKDDPQQELRWVQRIRRFGVISGLIFLVWIGTRLPRRRRA